MGSTVVAQNPRLSGEEGSSSAEYLNSIRDAHKGIDEHLTFLEKTLDSGKADELKIEGTIEAFMARVDLKAKKFSANQARLEQAIEGLDEGSARRGRLERELNGNEARFVKELKIELGTLIDVEIANKVGGRDKLLTLQRDADVSSNYPFSAGRYETAHGVLSGIAEPLQNYGSRSPQVQQGVRRHIASFLESQGYGGGTIKDVELDTGDNGSAIVNGTITGMIQFRNQAVESTSFSLSYPSLRLAEKPSPVEGDPDAAREEFQADRLEGARISLKGLRGVFANRDRYQSKSPTAWEGAMHILTNYLELASNLEAGDIASVKLGSDKSNISGTYTLKNGIEFNFVINPAKL